LAVLRFASTSVLLSRGKWAQLNGLGPDAPALAPDNDGEHITIRNALSQWPPPVWRGADEVKHVGEPVIQAKTVP
jgi:hypothetical protein